MLPLAPAVPLRRGFLHRAAAIVMRVAGWRAEGSLPADPRCVCIAAPHTTNWDGFWLVVIGWWFGVPLSWMLKHTWFRGPLKPFLEWTGAVPVDRRSPQGLVEQMVARFADGRPLLLAVPPEGTRKKRSHWKSGFYQIARAAGVPIVMGFLDYRRRAGGFGPTLRPTGDVSADMDAIRAFYNDIPGRIPERFTFPLLESEGLTEEEARRRVAGAGQDGT